MIDQKAKKCPFTSSTCIDRRSYWDSKNKRCSVPCWIKLGCNLQSNWVWWRKPFSDGQAWVDLLFFAHQPAQRYLSDGIAKEAKPGYVITSISSLSKQWGWSKKRVLRFLELLVTGKMIEFKNDGKEVLITILENEGDIAQ